MASGIAPETYSSSAYMTHTSAPRAKHASERVLPQNFLEIMKDLRTESVRIIKARRAAQQLLAWSVSSPVVRLAMSEPVRLHSLLLSLRSTDFKIRVSIAGVFMNLAAYSLKIRYRLLDYDAVPALRDSLTAGNDEVTVRYCAGALANLCHKLPDGRAACQEHGVMQALAVAIRSRNLQMRREVMRAIGNAVIDHRANCKAVVEAGAITWIVDACKQEDPVAAAAGAITLANLAVGDAQVRALIREEGALPPLGVLARSGAPVAMQAACTVLANLACDGPAIRMLLLEGGMVHSACGIVAKSVLPPECRAAACRLLWCTMVDTPAVRVAVHEVGALPLLVECVGYGSSTARCYACAALKHFCIDSYERQEAVVAAGGIPALVAQANDGKASSEIRRHALAALLEVSQNFPAAIEEIMSTGGHFPWLPQAHEAPIDRTFTPFKGGVQPSLDFSEYLAERHKSALAHHADHAPYARASDSENDSIMQLLQEGDSDSEGDMGAAGWASSSVSMSPGAARLAAASIGSYTHIHVASELEESSSTLPGAAEAGGGGELRGSSGWETSPSVASLPSAGHVSTLHSLHDVAVPAVLPGWVHKLSPEQYQSVRSRAKQQQMRPHSSPLGSAGSLASFLSIRK